MAQLGQITSLKSSKLIKFWLPLSFVAIAGGILILMLFTTLIFQAVYLNRVYPGISVMGIEAGGMTKVELTEAIAAAAPEYLNRTITLKTDEQQWIFTSQELGMRINTTVIANDIYAIGRQGNFTTDMVTHLSLLTSPREIDPFLWYDTGPTNEIIQELAQEINMPPQNAKLIIHPEARVEAIPAQRGQQLHQESALTAIEETLFSQTNDQVTLFVQEVIPAIPDVSDAEKQAEQLLNEPLVFRAETEGLAPVDWALQPETVVPLLEVVEWINEEGKSEVSIDLDAEKLTPYLEAFSEAVYQPPQDATLDFDDELGKVVVLTESQDGYTIDPAEVQAALPKLLTGGSNLVEVPLQVIPPRISSDNVEALGIQALISESTSYFKGSSAGRMHNINLAASQFQNVVIPPGEIFSFNEHLGDVSKEAGYDESLIIFGDRTTVGIGGGVCQVSTTVFRTAFFGGFEIVERWAHGYRVGWYETNSMPGLDATIYTPSVDFKFRNDTPGHILIKTVTDLDAGTTSFRFYGTPTNREVIISEPTQTNLIKPGPPIYEEDPSLPEGVVEQVDWANDGLNVTVTRTVKENDTILHEDEIISNYRPWRAVYKVGTGDSS